MSNPEGKAILSAIEDIRLHSGAPAKHEYNLSHFTEAELVEMLDQINSRINELKKEHGIDNGQS